MQLPMSLAIFDSGWISSDILSIVISIAVFVNSAKTIKNKELNKNNFSTIAIGKNIAVGASIMQTNISCLNASSDLNADINPSYEYLKAFNILAIPFFVVFTFIKLYFF